MKKEKVYLKNKDGHLEVGVISYGYPLRNLKTSFTYTEVQKGVCRKNRQFLAGANALVYNNVFAAIRAVNEKLVSIGSEWRVAGLV